MTTSSPPSTPSVPITTTTGANPVPPTPPPPTTPTGGGGATTPPPPTTPTTPPTPAELALMSDSEKLNYLIAKVATTATKEDIDKLNGEMANAATKEDIDKLNGEMNKRLSLLEKRTGILVEEKARARARKMFGEKWCEGFLFKSIHDVMKHLSKANDPELPSHDRNAENAAVESLVGFLEDLLPSFIASAGKAILDASAAKFFCHEDFEGAKTCIKEALDLVSPEQEAAGNVSNDMMKQSCGKLFTAITTLGTQNAVQGETVDDVQARVKRMTGRFQRKLQRITICFGGTQSVSSCLGSCDGPGILLCCALMNYDDVSFDKNKPSDIQALKTWIRDSCNVFESFEQVKCDIRGKVDLCGDSAIVEVGKIKSSSSPYHDAVQQMNMRTNLIVFVIRFVFGNNRFTHIIRKGHMFVVDDGAEDDAPQDMQQMDEGGVSIYVH